MLMLNIFNTNTYSTSGFSKIIMNVLIEQVLLPAYPGRQTQVNVVTPSTHIAPFLHGSGLQSSISENIRYNKK